MELNFVYCFDENFNLQALTSIKSLLDKITKKANIFIIHRNVESFKQISSAIFNHPNLLGLYTYQFDSNKVTLPPVKSHVSEATYYRLFISQYLPQDINFLIYLDADIVCVNDPTKKLINTFSQIESDNNVIAAKVETVRRQNNAFFDRLNLKSDEQFNAGVLVINYSAWLKQDIESNLLNLLNLRFNEIFDYDQEILNIYFDGQFTNLDKSLNYQATGRSSFDYIDKNVHFLHYLGKNKPWSVESYIMSTSIFYQKEYQKLGFKKPHLIFPRNLITIKKFFRLIFSHHFKNYDEPFLFLKQSLISFFKN